MKLRIGISIASLLLMVNSCIVFAQDNITVVTPSSEVAEGLDLYSVAEIFKDAENLEDFERDINDPEIGINNLDLDEDGYVDYIRVVEQITDYTHLIILQVLLGDDEFQDIATIEVEKTDENEYNMQVHGNEVFYGDDYYVAPTYVHVYRWPIITWIYRPVYRPYRSVYYYGYYPRSWRHYHPVTHHVYRTRAVRYNRRATFEVVRTSRVKTVHRVHYKPRSSTLVKKKGRLVHAKPAANNVKRADRKTVPATKATKVKRDVVRAPKKTVSKTTVRKNNREVVTRKKSAPINRSYNRSTEMKPVQKTRNKKTVNRSVKSKPIKKSTIKRTNKKPSPPKSVKKSTIRKSKKNPVKSKPAKKTTVKKSTKKSDIK